MLSDRVKYEILKDGTCSYCGRVADIIELPDGDTTYSDICDVCESYNLEVQPEEFDTDFDEF